MAALRWRFTRDGCRITDCSGDQLAARVANRHAGLETTDFSSAESSLASRCISGTSVSGEIRVMRPSGPLTEIAAPAGAPGTATA